MGRSRTGSLGRARQKRAAKVGSQARNKATDRSWQSDSFLDQRKGEEEDDEGEIWEL